MFKLFSTPKPDDLKLVWRFDSAGISVTAFFSDKPTEILYYHFQPLFFSAVDSVHTHRYDKLINRTQSVLGIMTKQFIEHAQRQPDSMEVIFGEPWSHVSVRHISYKRKTTFKLTNAFLNELVTRDLKNVRQRGSVITLDTNISKPVYHRVSIAGHPVYEITGQPVSDIRLDYTIGNVNADIITVVTNELHQRFHVSRKNITTHHYQDLLINFFARTGITNGCIIDVSGYITDAYVFQNGILKQWGTVPFGKLTMSEVISDRMGISIIEFGTLMKLYKKDLLAESMKSTIQSAFKKSINQWTTDLQNFLASAATDGMIMDQVIWVGGDTDPLLSLFARTVQSDTIVFPHIFGTHQVGIMFSSALFSAFNNYEDIRKSITEDQDIIINLALL